jgi:CubicO group peptidase (beta-lactamase class C family)
MAAAIVQSPKLLSLIAPSPPRKLNPGGDKATLDWWAMANPTIDKPGSPLSVLAISRRPKDDLPALVDRFPGVLMSSLSRCLFPPLVITTIAVATAALAGDLQRAAPEDAGLSTDRLARVAAVVKPYIDDRDLAGAVIGVARDNKLVYLESFGKMDTGKPMRADTIFRLTAMTKPITAVAVMMLYEEGRFVLTDPIAKYIPAFEAPKVVLPDGTTEPARRDITILDLLTQTSGLTYRFWGQEPISSLYRKAGISDGLAPTEGSVGDMVSQLATLPLAHHPGEAFTEGLDFDVLGHLVELVSGLPLDRFLEDRIFTPLRMADTGFYISDAQRDRLSALYVPGGRGGLVKASDKSIRWAQLLFAANLPYADTRTYFSGGAGLTATAGGYLRFAQMMLNGGELYGNRLLGRKTVELMTGDCGGDLSIWDTYNPTRVGNLGDAIGLGFGVRTERGLTELGSVGEYMWAGLYTTRFWIDPREKMSIVMMSQRLPRFPDLEAKIHTAVYQAIID